MSYVNKKKYTVLSLIDNKLGKEHFSVKKRNEITASAYKETSFTKSFNKI